jgi:hypothetical protein
MSSQIGGGIMKRLELDQSLIDEFVCREIAGAALTPSETLIAQFLWSVREFIRNERVSKPDRPLEKWTVAEIIEAARTGSLR